MLVGLDLLAALLGWLVVGWLVSWWWVDVLVGWQPEPPGCPCEGQHCAGSLEGKGRWVTGITTGGEVGG